MARKAYLSDVRVLDLVANAWVETPLSAGSAEDEAPHTEEEAPARGDHPGARAFHCAAALGATGGAGADSRLVVFGGRRRKTRMNDAWLLDAGEWRWSRVRAAGEPPSPRDFASAARAGTASVGYGGGGGDAGGVGRMVVHGGWDGKAWLGDAWLLSLHAQDGEDGVPATWQQLQLGGSPLPAPRNGHALVAAADGAPRLILFGGGGANGTLMNDAWSVDVEPDGASACSRLPSAAPLPQGRSGHSMARLGPVMVVCGGHGTSGWLQKTDKYLDDVWLLALPTLRWSRATCKAGADATPTPRAYHASAAVGGRVLVVGGYDGKQSLADCWWLALRDGAAAEAGASALAASAGAGAATERAQAATTQAQMAQQQGAADDGRASAARAPAAPVPSPAQQAAAAKEASQGEISARRSSSFFSTLSANFKAMQLFGGPSGSAAAAKGSGGAGGGAAARDQAEAATARRWAELRRSVALDPSADAPHAPRLSPPAAPIAALAAIGRRVASGAGGGAAATEQGADEDAAMGRAYLLSCDANALALDEVQVMLRDYKRAVWGKALGGRGGLAVGADGALAEQWQQFVGCDVGQLGVVDDVALLQSAYSSAVMS